MRRRLTLVLGLLAVMAVLYAAGAWLGHRTTVLRLEERGQAALGSATDRLAGQLDRYRYLPSILADHPSVLAAIGDEQVREATSALLERFAGRSGALDIYLMDAAGTTVASSNYMLPHSFMGQNFAWRPYFQRASDGALGFYHAVGAMSGTRGFYFASPVRDARFRVIGVVAVKVDLERIEASWRGDPMVVFFTDQAGVVFVANRGGMILRAVGPAAPLSANDQSDGRQYAGRQIAPMVFDTAWTAGGNRVWLGQPGDDLPARGLWLSSSVPTIGMTANVLLDLEEAGTQAMLWGSLGAVGGGFLYLLSAVAMIRRRVLAARLASEAAANATLEIEVEARTRELSDINRRLRAEVEERAAAEAALREVQDQLVQAGKLKALGELSAGISHELNQPLTAIRALTDNTEILLERGNQGAVRRNLAAIADIAERAARIIRNLKAFARKEGEPVAEVDLVEAVRDAVDILASRIAANGVTLVWSPPEGPVTVRGGRVRLQQVIVNLMSNALDAMDGQAAAQRIDIAIEAGDETVRLIVSDTGPGLAAPGQVFDPFFTTKAVGQGLGLGLSISYGIVQSFGGNIRGETRAGGGAVFTVELSAAGGTRRAA